jgi:hypothetical protein
MAKSVLLAQLSEEQSLMWHSVLSSHQLEVWAAPETEDLLKMLDQKYQAKQPLPELIISDIGIRYGGGHHYWRQSFVNGVQTMRPN